MYGLLQRENKEQRNIHCRQLNACSDKIIIRKWCVSGTQLSVSASFHSLDSDIKENLLLYFCFHKKSQSLLLLPEILLLNNV